MKKALVIGVMAFFAINIIAVQNATAQNRGTTQPNKTTVSAKKAAVKTDAGKINKTAKTQDKPQQNEIKKIAKTNDSNLSTAPTQGKTAGKDATSVKTKKSVDEINKEIHEMYKENQKAQRNAKKSAANTETKTKHVTKDVDKKPATKDYKIATDKN